MQAADAAGYTVVITNAIGSVDQYQCRPDGDKYPAGDHRAADESDGGAGSTVTLTVLATGTPPLSYQWC